MKKNVCFAFVFNCYSKRVVIELNKKRNQQMEGLSQRIRKSSALKKVNKKGRPLPPNSLTV